jgi:predicted dienelactone hydrolase
MIWNAAAASSSATGLPSLERCTQKDLEPMALARAMIAVQILIACLVTLCPSVVLALVAPDGPGEHRVGHTQDTLVDAARANRSLPIHIWYPADEASWTAEPQFTFDVLLGPIGILSDFAKDDVDVSSGQFSLIVFSHGFGGIPTQSRRLVEHLASHGFVVVAISHTGNDQEGGSPYASPEADRYPDVAFTIDEVGLMDADVGSVFFGHVDHLNAGVVGHSYGGMTAEFMAAGYGASPADSRVKAIMPIAASSSALSDPDLVGITIPTLLLCGTLDGLLSEQIRGFGLISSAPNLFRVDLTGAKHTHFADNICDIGNALIDAGVPKSSWAAVGAGALIAPYEAVCEPPAYDIDEASRIQQLYAAAHFRAYLNSEDGYLDYLTTSYAEQNEPDVVFFGSGPLVGAEAVPAMGLLARGLLLGCILLAGAGAISGRGGLGGRRFRP